MVADKTTAVIYIRGFSMSEHGTLCSDHARVIPCTVYRFFMASLSFWSVCAFSTFDKFVPNAKYLRIALYQVPGARYLVPVANFFSSFLCIRSH